MRCIVPVFHLQTRCRRFLHTTWLGKKIVDFWWHGLADSSVRLVPPFRRPVPFLTMTL